MNVDVKIVVEEGIAVIRLNRPEAANAMNRGIVAILREMFEGLRNDSSVRGVVITGEGKHFCAGADIGEMAEMDDVAAREFAETGQKLMFAIEGVGKPVIAAVNGHAAGGGLELALACDFIVAAESAVFVAPEVRLGIIPGFGGTQRLSRLVGKARAKELIYTGQGINARVACAIGLVNRIFPDGSLLNGAVDMMKDICFHSPISLRLAKEVIDTGSEIDLTNACHIELDAFAFCFNTDDRKEGISAFLEKRRPGFTGK
ncbi:MAG TPA: enoyl-CoA hydratase-related protein [Geobacteraceae bacterium]|nr:enoyl-CoA hydratase-related protein [Geobacteraceae bacterium]